MLYQDLCCLKVLAFGPSQESDFSRLYLRDVFLDALNDRELRKLVLIQEPCTMEEALRLACRLEAIDASDSTEGDRDSTSKRRVHKMDDGIIDHAVEKGDDVGVKRQLAEMRKALQNVRQELSKQNAPLPVSLNIDKQVEIPVQRYQSGLPLAPLMGLSEQRDIPARTRQAPGRPFDSYSARVGQDTCHYCREVGHWACDCLKLKFKKSTAVQKNYADDGAGKKFPVNKPTAHVLNSPSKRRTEAYRKFVFVLETYVRCWILVVNIQLLGVDLFQTLYCNLHESVCIPPMEQNCRYWAKLSNSFGSEKLRHRLRLLLLTR